MVLPKSKFNNKGEPLFWTDWDQVFVGMVDDPAVLFSCFGSGFNLQKLQGGGHKKQSFYSTELAKMKKICLTL